MQFCIGALILFSVLFARFTWFRVLVVIGLLWYNSVN